MKIDLLVDFAKSGDSIQEWSEKNSEVKWLTDRTSSFENELIQVLETNSKESIQEYFQSSRYWLSIIKDKFRNENIQDLIEKYNDEEKEKYDVLIKKKTDEYFKSPDREFGHLETITTKQPENPIFKSFPRYSYSRVNYNYYCIEEIQKSVDPHLSETFLSLLLNLYSSIQGILDRYEIDYKSGFIKPRTYALVELVPIVFFEGDTDIEFTKKAAILLGREDLISRVVMRHRNGKDNLDKLWRVLNDFNWETNPQKKLFIYDCDVKGLDESNGYNQRIYLPVIRENPIKVGIENLFPQSLIDRANATSNKFVDYSKTSGTKRGIPFNEDFTKINKDEKRAFCN